MESLKHERANISSSSCTFTVNLQLTAKENLAKFFKTSEPYKNEEQTSKTNIPIFVLRKWLRVEDKIIS